jgi:hypothetical protein
MLFAHVSLLLIAIVKSAGGFQVVATNSVASSRCCTVTFRTVVCPGIYNHRCNSYHLEGRLQSQRDDNNSNAIDDDPIIPLASFSKQQQEEAAMTEAATNTINERLMAELVQAENKEKYGKRSSMSKSMGMSPFGSMRSDEERQLAIDEARNLNGVNPAVAIVGGVFGVAVATGLWYGTTALGTFFALHPVETNVYFLLRVTSVFRNVVMGLSSLASGFFGVTGVGILALGIRVAYGVMTGELDPTPIKKRRGDELDIPNVWDLMMNKKPNQRRNK